MGKNIDSLVPDIYAMMENAGNELFNLELFQSFGENLKSLMEDRFHSIRDKNPRLRMSNIGRPDRQLWYDINSKGDKENLQAPTLIKFQYGDMIEQMILLYAKMAGHSVEQEQAEVELDDIKGHIDCVIDGVLVDVKSASSFSFQKFESGALFLPGNDPFGYVAQICGYAAATGCERAGFLAVDKTLGKICFCEIPADVMAQYHVHQRIAHIKAVVASPELPPRCYSDVPDGKSGNMKLDTGCSYCPHKHACWADTNNGAGLRVYSYSTGPRFITRLVREPKVPSFEAA